MEMSDKQDNRRASYREQRLLRKSNTTDLSFDSPEPSRKSSTEARQSSKTATPETSKSGAQPVRHGEGYRAQRNSIKCKVSEEKEPDDNQSDLVTLVSEVIAQRTLSEGQRLEKLRKLLPDAPDDSLLEVLRGASEEDADAPPKALKSPGSPATNPQPSNLHMSQSGDAGSRSSSSGSSGARPSRSAEGAPAAPEAKETMLEEIKKPPGETVAPKAFRSVNEQRSGSKEGPKKTILPVTYSARRGSKDATFEAGRRRASSSVLLQRSELAELHEAVQRMTIEDVHTAGLFRRLIEENEQLKMQIEQSKEADNTRRRKTQEFMGSSDGQTVEDLSDELAKQAAEAFVLNRELQSVREELLFIRESVPGQQENATRIAGLEQVLDKKTTQCKEQDWKLKLSENQNKMLKERIKALEKEIKKATQDAGCSSGVDSGEDVKAPSRSQSAEGRVEKRASTGSQEGTPPNSKSVPSSIRESWKARTSKLATLW